MFKKNRVPSFYALESKRIQDKLAGLTPGTDDYKKLMDDLVTLRKFTGEEKEMKQFFDKPGRASIIGKIVGFLGIGGLAFGLAKMEKLDGRMLTGSSAETGKGLLKTAFKLFG